MECPAKLFTCHFLCRVEHKRAEFEGVRRQRAKLLVALRVASMQSRQSGKPLVCTAHCLSLSVEHSAKAFLVFECYNLSIYFVAICQYLSVLVPVTSGEGNPVW